MPFPFASFVIGAHLLIAAPAGPPTVDIQKTCLNDARAVIEEMGEGAIQRDVDSCLKSEQTAHDELEKQWTTYSTAEKSQCVQPQAYQPSYIEWLVCLEMEKEVRHPSHGSAMPTQGTTPGQSTPSSHSSMQ